jgi:hypothetical protein
MTSDLLPAFSEQNIRRRVDDVTSQFKGSLDLWPKLIEIARD